MDNVCNMHGEMHTESCLDV